MVEGEGPKRGRGASFRKEDCEDRHKEVATKAVVLITVILWCSHNEEEESRQAVVTG